MRSGSGVDNLEKVIHDPVHGSMRLSGLVLQLVDSPEVQRLRGIKQLGLANLVFPGANHSRFEHVLGVSHLVEQLGRELGISKDELDTLAAAAVLHDIGHPPYSHTLEYLMNDYLKRDHMEFAGDILMGKATIYDKHELGDIREPPVPVVDVLSDHGISPSEVAGLVLGKHRKPYIGQIIHSDIDADQMDYLLRDAHSTGVALGMIDVDRLMGVIIVRKNRLAIEDKGIEAVEGFMTARALMYTSVYFHHTVRIAELMLANAVGFAIEKGGPINKDNFYRLTDAELMERLHSIQGYPRDTVTRLKYRRLYKTAYVEERRELTRTEKNRMLKKFGKWREVLRLQDEIAEMVRLPRGKVLLDVPIVDVLLSEPRLEKVEVPAISEGKLVRMSELSPIAEALKKRQAPRYLLRVVTDSENVSKVRRAASKVLE
jgi:HD superfamily phosphohydrolase